MKELLGYFSAVNSLAMKPFLTEVHLVTRQVLLQLSDSLYASRDSAGSPTIVRQPVCDRQMPTIQTVNKHVTVLLD